MNYTSENMLKIAKRYNNSKRSYLLVNPLQAKHMAVNPEKSLNMMNALGKILSEKYPDTKLVIGFAETATAIGAEVARCFNNDCNYIHTTREDIENYIPFSEEHSHAVEQKLCSENLTEYLSETKSVIFIDDEISTGKTLINIIDNFRKEFPELNQKEIICASLINRVSDENMKRLEISGIKCEYLLKLPDEDYEIKVKDIKVSESQKITDTSLKNPIKSIYTVPVMNTRKGVNINEYYNFCIKTADKIIQKTGKLCGDTLVLGTEEFMYPALILGQKIGENAFCHATTRSPVGIYSDENYPIKEGFKIPSFYDENRETYIYNLRKYNNVIIFTDSKEIPQKAIYSLAKILENHECENIFIVKGC